MNVIIAYIICAAAGALVGAFFVHVFKPKTIGYLRVDRSDPDERPYLFLELTEGLDQVLRQKEVVMKVKIQDYIPHK